MTKSFLFLIPTVAFGAAGGLFGTPLSPIGGGGSGGNATNIVIQAGNNIVLQTNSSGNWTIALNNLSAFNGQNISNVAYVLVGGTGVTVSSNNISGVPTITINSTATGTGSSNITDSAFIAVVRNINVSTNFNSPNDYVTNWISSNDFTNRSLSTGVGHFNTWQQRLMLPEYLTLPILEHLISKFEPQPIGNGIFVK